MAPPTTGKKAVATPGKGSTTNKTAKQPAGAGPKGSTTVSVLHVNAGGQKSGTAKNALSAAEKQQIKAKDSALRAKKDAEFNGNKAKEKYIRGRKLGFSAKCRPSLDVYLFTKGQVPSRSGAKGDWICSMKQAITFRELKYQNQENEFRVFIEGAEVTHYIQGSLSWTMESTGGMNTARFVLNNNEDIFIITPQNVCAGPYNRSGWRVAGLVGTGKTAKIYDYVFRNNFRVDEAAKWKIYRTKYEIVAPGTDDAQIDSYTGMWLYPLNPYSCIFNRNDVVRIFVRLPHVSSFKRPGFKQWYSVWMPAFTGFIKDYNWNDDPVGGLRVVNITCYDYRGLMDRMRVRTNIPPDKGKSKKPKQKKKSGAAAKGAQSSQSATSTNSNQPSYLKDAYLRPAQAVGAQFEKRFGYVYKQYSTMLASLGQPKLSNPYVFADTAFFMVGTLDDLYALWFAKLFLMGTGGAKSKGCGGTRGTAADSLARGRTVQAGRGLNIPCSQAAVRTIDEVMGARAANITRATAKLVNNFGLVYELVGMPTEVNRNMYPTGKTSVTLKISISTSTNQRTGGTQAAGAKHKQIIESGKATSVVGVLEKVKKLVAARYEPIKAALGAMYTHSGFLTNGSMDAAIATQKANDDGMAVLKKVDTDVEAIINNSPLLTREQGKSKRVIKVTTAATAAIQRTLTSFQNQLKTFTDKLACYKAEFANPNDFKKLKCNPKQKAVRKPNAIQDDIFKVEGGVKGYRAAIASIERKRASAGIKQGAKVYNRLGFKFPSFEGLAFTLGTSGVKLTPRERAGTYYADRTKVEAATTKALRAYITNIDKGIQGAKKWANEDVRNATNAQVAVINAILAAVAADRKKFEKLLGPKHANMLKSVGLNKVKDVITAVRATTDAGKKEMARAKTLPEVLTKYAHFEVKQAGVFADLATTSKKQPHPLMGKSFEQALEYLCTEGSVGVTRGVIMGISSYNESSQKSKNIKAKNNPATVPTGDTKLDQFNRVVLFGVVGRPLTFQEVSAIGRGTVSDLKEDFSPFNIFWHMLRPANGTAPSTIIQQQTGQTGMNSTSVNYETRRKLLDDICSILDYQFYVSGWGDLVFEMPNYNAFPGDFGSAFRDAYTLLKDWKTASIAEEAQEIPTAWVVTGLEPEFSIAKGTASGVAEHEFRKIVIMAPILARRLGVRVHNINLRIPGIGAPAGVAGGSKQRSSPKQALAQLEAYGFFYIQRQLGRAHTVSVSLPFRPYIIPNRPMWLVHRQRIGLVQNVTHTMTPPNGECITDVSMGYTRWLHRDGTFRFIAGGQRQPIDYTAFFTGLPSYTPTEGVRTGGKSKTGKAVGRVGTGVNCEALMARARQASAFSAAVAGNFGPAFQTPSQAGAANASPPKGWAVNPPASGLRRQSVGGNPDAPPSNPDASAAIGASGNADPLKYFQSPWKYLDPKGGNNYQSYGFLRQANNRYYSYRIKRGRNKQDAFHSGWDIIAPVGTHQFTPIPVLSAACSMSVGPLTGATTYAYIKRNRLKGSTGGKLTALEAFAVRKNGVPIQVGSGEGAFVKIYADQYVLWQAMVHRHGKGPRLWRQSGGGGMYLQIGGYYSNPKLGNKGTMRVSLLYVHNADLAKIDGQALGLYLKEAPNISTPLAKPGDTIPFVGKTGTRQAHLHLSMWIDPHSGKTDADKNLINLALAANKQFLDSTLYARAKMWTYDGTDPKNKVKLNQRAADYWQIRAGKFKKKRGQVKVADVVKYYQKRKTYRDLGGSWDKSDKKMVKVNAALFFAPQQVVDLQRSKRKQSTRTRYGIYAGAASQMGTAAYTRTKLSEKLCSKYSQEKEKVAQAGLWNCASVTSQRLSSGSLTMPQYKEALKKCQKPFKAIIYAARKGWIARQGATRAAVNKEIDVIAKKLESRRYLQMASKGASMGLVYLNYDKRR